METFIDRHKDADDGSDNTTNNESIRAPNIETADQSDDQGQWINNLKFHKNLHSANPFAGYDYIIALSGVNDIKRAAVPFLIEDDATSDDGTNVKDFFNLSGFYGDLHSFITGVKHISNSLNKGCKNDEALRVECRDSDQLNMPRIIFPSFPTEHVPAGSILRWIAVKSTGYLDSVKKSIADEHHNVYAVPCARDQDSLDFLEKKGSIWNAYPPTFPMICPSLSAIVWLYT